MSRSVHADLLVIRVFSTGNLPTRFLPVIYRRIWGGSPKCPEPLISFLYYSLQCYLNTEYPGAPGARGVFILVGFSMLVEGFLGVW